MKKYLTILALSGLLCGCKSPGHVDPGVLSHLSLGMSKEQVIETVGRPESDAAEGNKETLYYVEERPWWQWKRMQVKLVDGKVVSYGEVGAK
jgi:outer membrane protein assembly factor BamE (lipoprotein component of BamABCDE complex)